MSKGEYKIKADNSTNNSEDTSMIAALSYDIENANNNSLHSKKTILNFFI